MMHHIGTVSPSTKPAALICLISILVLSLVVPSARLSAGEALKWHSYEDGMALSRGLNKKVLINFYADWCTYCRKMDRETYRNRAVSRFLNDNFIAIKVDSERENHIAAVYNVQELPSTSFVTSNIS